jgi:hypothetical protein
MRHWPNGEKMFEGIVKPEAYWRYGKTYPGQETVWSDWKKNKICIGYANLVGGLLSQGSPGAYQAPAPTVLDNVHRLYIAVGGGLSGWDAPLTPTPQPNGGETSLINEISRKGCDVLGYVPDDATVLTPPVPGGSNPVVIRRPVFTASWAAVDLVPATIREVGLFGGKNSDSEFGAIQYMISLLRFPAVQKDAINPYILTWQTELWVNYL